MRLRGGAFCVLTLCGESSGHWFESVYGLVCIFASGIYFCVNLVFYLVCQSLRVRAFASAASRRSRLALGADVLAAVAVAVEER